jgi:hypothetical protein
MWRIVVISVTKAKFAKEKTGIVGATTVVALPNFKFFKR